MPLSMKKIAEHICRGYFDNNNMTILRTRKLNCDSFLAKITYINEDFEGKINTHWIRILKEENDTMRDLSPYEDHTVRINSHMIWAMGDDWIDEEAVRI